MKKLISSMTNKELVLFGFIAGFVLMYLMMSYSIDRGCREVGKAIIWDLTYIECEVVQ